jgi:carbon monoxide dehydrogenase subunit G
MTVRVERVFELPVPQSEVWEHLSDPEVRADPISVVDDFETTGDRTAIWYVKLPIPRLEKVVPIETEDVDIDPGEYVKFLGRSKAVRVQGEHVLEATETGTQITNRFVVDGRIPGVETYFKRKLDDELANLETAVRAEFGLSESDLEGRET